MTKPEALPPTPAGAARLAELQESTAALDAAIAAMESQLADLNHAREQLLTTARQVRRVLNDKLAAREQLLRAFDPGVPAQSIRPN